MKKMKFYAVLVSVLALLLVGCANTELNTTKRGSTEVAALKTDENILVFSTLSSASTLKEEVVSALNGDASFGQKEELEIDMDKANEYLLMMENILADGGPIVSNETASDREGYDLMMTITVKGLAGNVSVYTIYYSIIIDEAELPSEELPEQPSTEETLPEEGTESEVKEPSLRGHWGYKDEDDDKKDHKYNDYHDKAHDQFKHHYEDKENAVEYAIDALAVIDGVEYEVFGKKEVETEEDGEEVEIKFVVKLDDDNYVSVEQEFEGTEVEYEYTVFQNRRKVSTLKFKSEEEDGKTCIKLTTTNEQNEKEIYKFIKDAGKTIIKYETRGYSYTLIVTSSVDEEGNTVYDYIVKEKDFKWQFCKNHKHH